ncbi:MAG: SIMPL domain-containing protein [Arenibacterium sp.]
MRLFCAALVVLGVCGAPLATNAQDLRQITVTGEGRVDVAPDMALITLGVTQQADAAQEAMAATSEAVGQILTRLDQIGLAARDVQTRRITLNPVWVNDRYESDNPPKIAGFVAANTIAIRVRALDQLGEVLDAVIEDGANTFNGLQFLIADPAPLMNEARKKAVADAMARAALLTEAAGVTLGPVRSIDERGGGGGPMMMEMAAARSANVPIASGEVSLSASVTMVFDIVD